MQVLKRYTIPDRSSEIFLPARRVYWSGYSGAANSTVSVHPVSEDWCSLIADFLSSCGVDCSWEVREGDENKWLWINNEPYFLGVGSNGSLTWYYGSGHSESIYAAGMNELTLYFSFVGNPKGAFVFRTFAALGGDSMEFGVGFFKIVSTITRDLYNAIALRIGGSSTPTTRGILPNGNTITLNLTATTVWCPVNTFREYDCRGKFPLSLINHEAVVGYGCYSVGCYRYPVNAGLPTAASKHSVYQVETVIDEKKYLVTTGGSSFNNYMSMGLVALEDDDPLISEEDLMAQIGGAG